MITVSPEMRKETYSASRQMKNEKTTERVKMIRRYWDQFKIMPTLQEIQEMCGMKSHYSAVVLTRKLIRLGIIKKIGSRMAPGEKFFKENV